MNVSVVSRFLFVGCIAASTALVASGCQARQEAVQSQFIPESGSRSFADPMLRRDNLHVLHAFDPTRSNGDGGTPISGLIEVGGKFYGTTWTGGALHSWGTVFEVDGKGRERVIHRFLGGYSYTDGGNPYGGLTSMGDEMYGTTFNGGAYNNSGTVFAITAKGKEAVIHSFGAGDDGDNPAGDLLAYNGVLYGTTSYGGDGKHCGSNCGAVFAISPSGSERIVHSFHGSDGARPYGGVIAVNGLLYGTTVINGGYYGGEGTAYAVSPSGTFKRIHIFGKNGDGSNPYGTLLFVRGALYGTTSAGGAHGAGTIFKLDLNGSERVLYSFTGALDGARPEGGLIWVDGELIGTTSGGGGGCGCGTIFAVDLKGNEKTLHRLDGIHDGEYPQDTLLYSGSALYGTAYTGGADQFGTVFRLRY